MGLLEFNKLPINTLVGAGKLLKPLQAVEISMLLIKENIV